MAILKQVDGKAFFNVPDEDLERYVIPADKLGDALRDTGIKLGSSVDQSEIAGKKVLRAADRPAQASADASAQYLRQSVAICPNCSGSNLVWEETTEYRLFQCGHCGYVFRF
ncbi:MAG: hypothetical protein IT379_23905 [Deltaproteobacteria bacterium]|nr:hypothetical protein [Deltaproteobacteria bacterium]